MSDSYLGPQRLIDTSLNVEWQANTLCWMLRSWCYLDDPEHALEVWLEDAAASDAPYVMWVLKTWQNLSTLSHIQQTICLELAEKVRRDSYR